MKQINGIPHNISESIVGVISTKGVNLFKRRNIILVDPLAKDNTFGYKATITALSDIKPKGKIISKVQNISDFNDGDVVLLNDKGEIIFHYEINSLHNAIFATGKCNHRCIMCPQPPVTEEPDLFDFNCKIISLASPHTKEFGITGGEPTLVGDKLFEYLRLIQKRMPNTAINILSNGVRFADKSYAATLEACKCKDLQIDIPIFSDIPEIHNRIVGAKTFYQTVQGLYNLAYFRQRIGIRVVVHKQTYKRLPQLAEYIYRNLPFVSQVAFLQMETIGIAEENLPDLWIDPFDYNDQLSEAVEILDNRGIRPLIYNAQLCVLPEHLRKFAANSISDWKDTYLPSCELCDLKCKCGGFFESNVNKRYSVHIKPVQSYTPAPEPRNFESSSLLAEFQNFTKINSDWLVYDIPSGYGRNIFPFAQKCSHCVAFDINKKTLEALEDEASKRGISDNITTSLINLNNDLSHLNKCDVLINVHLYSRQYIIKLLNLIREGGYILIETPSIIGGNTDELPQPGEIQNLIENSGFEIKLYSESKEKNGKVAVKAIAYKPLLFNI